MSALKIKFGSTHHITHIDDQTKGKLIVGLECGAEQEVNDDNRHRFEIIPTDDGSHVGCPFCRMSLDAKEDEQRDDHSDPENA